MNGGKRKCVCVRTRGVFFQRSIGAAFVETHAFVCFHGVYVRLSRFLMKYVERISSRIIRIHYETHFESQGKDFARERMFWYREISHKHDLSLSPHTFLTLSLSLFLPCFRFTRSFITVLVVYSLSSFSSFACIHIYTAVNTRAISSTRLSLNILSQNNLISISNILDIK